jgi:endonuclease YncB( thermonuclease family)
MVMMRQLALLVLSLVLVFMPAAFGLPDEAVGRVVSVISGDSLGIEMLIADARTNNIDSIKLADIQAPSTVTAEGKVAQKYAFSLLKNKTVYLDINDNASGTRNEWSQLICVIYLMDSEYRPVWPPLNRILVDGGYARLIETENCEFNSSAWWQPPPVFPPGEKRDRLLAMLEGKPQPEQVTFVGPSSSSNGVIMGSSKKGSVLEKDSASGRVSIGYRT